MKTFPTYDYTLCNTKECTKKETCVRHLTYRKAQEEKYRAQQAAKTAEPKSAQDTKAKKKKKK